VKGNLVPITIGVALGFFVLPKVLKAIKK